MDPTARCELCGSLCYRKVSKTEKNPGREFFKCRAHEQFCMWVDQLRACPCGQGQCIVRQSKSGSDIGRYYWLCTKSEAVIGKGCGFFEYTDEAGSSSSTSTQRVGSSSVVNSSGTSTTPPSKEFLRGYLRGAIFPGKQHAKLAEQQAMLSQQHTQVFEEILEAVDSLDLNK